MSRHSDLTGQPIARGAGGHVRRQPTACGEIHLAEWANAPLRKWIFVVVTYFFLLLAFWFAARYYDLATRVGGHFPSAFLSFALLLAPLWVFGFGAAPLLENKLRSGKSRILLPSILVIPYLIFSIPRGEFRAATAASFFAIAIGIAAVLGSSTFFRSKTEKLRWHDLLALAIVGLPIQFRWLEETSPGLGGALSRLLLLDAALYAFLVVRRLEGVGYDFRPRVRDLAIGIREWVLFAPLGISVGLALRFSRFHAQSQTFATVAATLLITFFFVAIPQEFFFRGLLQNLLEARLGRTGSLLIAAIVFGLSHFNQGATFNWRFVLLATIAGVFYGRAWQDSCRLLPAVVTHTAVNVVWSFWFL